MPRLYRPGGLARDPLYFWHACPRLRAVVVSIPKNACTAQKRWMLGAEGIDPGPDAHAAAFRRLSMLNQPAARRTEALERWPVVAFLRDPFDRLFSAFRDKFLGRHLNFPAASAIEGAAAAGGRALRRDRAIAFPAMGPDALLAACDGVDYARGLSFREFVAYLAATPDLDLDPHWRPQTWFLGPTRPRAGGAAPPARLEPMSRVGAVLAELGAAAGIPGPSPRDRGGDAASAPPAPPEADLSDVPSGRLRLRRPLPSARELIAPDLEAALRRRYAADVGLWRFVAAEGEGRGTPAEPAPVAAATMPA